MGQFILLSRCMPYTFLVKSGRKGLSRVSSYLRTAIDRFPVIRLKLYLKYGLSTQQKKNGKKK